MKTGVLAALVLAVSFGAATAQGANPGGSSTFAGPSEVAAPSSGSNIAATTDSPLRRITEPPVQVTATVQRATVGSGPRQDPTPAGSGAFSAGADGRIPVPKPSTMFLLGAGLALLRLAAGWLKEKLVTTCARVVQH